MKCVPPHSYPVQVVIHWYHNYQKIQPANGVTIDQSGTLSFTAIKKSDEGEYFCDGTNPVSQESRTSSVAHVTVNGKELVKFKYFVYKCKQNANRNCCNVVMLLLLLLLL